MRYIFKLFCENCKTINSYVDGDITKYSCGKCHQQTLTKILVFTDSSYKDEEDFHIYYFVLFSLLGGVIAGLLGVVVSTLTYYLLNKKEINLILKPKSK